MLVLGHILVIAVLLGILALRWYRPDAWAQTFFKVLWWIVLLLLAIECLEAFAAWLMPA
jgi:hypothetical protein